MSRLDNCYVQRNGSIFGSTIKIFSLLVCKSVSRAKNNDGLSGREDNLRTAEGEEDDDLTLATVVIRGETFFAGWVGFLALPPALLVQAITSCHKNVGGSTPF